MRGAYEVGSPLNAKMFWERINGVDIEPWKAICSFVLDYLCYDVFANSNRGNLL